MPKKKLDHGGKREHAGRPAPKEGRKRGISVSLTPDVLAYLESILGDEAPQKANVRSRSDVINDAIKATPEFKTWEKKQ